MTWLLRVVSFAKHTGSLMLTMSLTAKEDQPCNSKRTFSKGEFVSGKLFSYVAIIVIVNVFLVIVIVDSLFVFIPSDEGLASQPSAF